MHADAIDTVRPPVDLSAALSASGVVGTWSWSDRPDGCVLDAGAAEILAGNAGLAGRPVPLEQAKACVHPDDRPELFRHFRSVRREGGLFVAVYRTVSARGETRRILDRGRIDARGGTCASGHGIIIDLTDTPVAEDAPAAAFLDPDDALDAAAAHAMACREAIDGLADSELRLLVDVLLLGLGRRLARAQMAPAGRGH